MTDNELQAFNAQIEKDKIRAEMRAELEAELRAQIEQEFQDRSLTAMTLQDIADSWNMTTITVSKVLEMSGVKSVVNGRFKLYDPKDVKRARINKDRKVLEYWGLVHQVEREHGLVESVVEA